MATRTHTFEVSGMHCASCGLLVDDCVEDLDGVVTSTTDVRSGRCVVVADAGVSEAAILGAVAEAGYTGVAAR